MMRRTDPLRALVLVAAVVAVAAPVPATAQDANFLLPIAEIEQILREGDMQVLDVRPSRGLPGERTYRVTLQSGDHVLQVKYAPATEGADEFNNQPRYELAAYGVQALFLDEREMVVPPTAIRAFPIDVVRETVARTGDTAMPPEPTFGEWPMTLVALQYWMFNVDLPEELPDEDRIEEDEVYERLVGNFNLLTYIIRHSDSNEGNFVQSLDPAWPRVFSVDNGVAFASEPSNRGTQWRNLRLDRYPASAIDRLRGLSLEELQSRLGILVELELRDGNFVEVEPTENLDPGRGVRRDAERIQLGLTEREIGAMHGRIVRLLERVDDGRYELIP
ncbi:MAG: hypothetical protein OXI39_13880 [Gemmatimonadota bacterium]|uniref:hypothetical protein n=1 Tax=Candidatus Palauibacter scopulicola TaxID=3056741 RepID=UPI0023875300|nr:hypothetical protein [Candidatus Palauibacter scopulicola]MDE2664079.1 hypothetical protein [Candidatus Palauibacter scopulicola]